MKKTITFLSRRAAVLLLATLLLTLTAQTARAAGDIYVGYLDPTAPIGQQRKTVLNPVRVDGNTTEMGTADETTWYLVSGTFTNDTRIEVKGTVNLILTDGCNFTVSKGIHVPEGSALNIYAQCVANSGSLTAARTNNDAAIGGNGGEGQDGDATSGESAGDITIYGGSITITNGNIGGGDGGNGRAGGQSYSDEDVEHSDYFAGNGGNGGNGNVTIYSGFVWVKNGNIGGGKAGTGQDSPGGDSGSDGSNGDGTVNLSWANTSDGIYADNYYGTVTLLKAFDGFGAGEVINNDEIESHSLMYAGDSYTVTIGSMPDGVTATADLVLDAGFKKAVVGQVVTISFSGVPDGKVPVVSVTYGANNYEVFNIFDNGDGTFSFEMPDGNVTVTASELKNDIKSCTATVPNQSLGTNSYINYKFWDTPATIGETVTDDETTLTLGTDYQFGRITYADLTNHSEFDMPDHVGDECRVEIVGQGDYAGSKWASFKIIAPDANGKWGDLTWAFDGDSQTLTITGTGAMQETTQGNYPWYETGSYINTITIDEDITTVAANAFAGTQNINPYSSVTSVSLPTTLTTIGDKAFAYCTGLTVDLDDILDKNITLGNNAFYQIGCLAGSLANMANNATKIALLDQAISNNITLKDRTLYKDGDWNTLCLPFAVTDFTGTPLEGATVKELLTTSNLDNTGKLTLNFSDDLTAIEAGKPYIVKWTPNLTISSASDWDAFATAVSGGTTYEGQIVKLAADISVSTMVGAVSGSQQQKAFQGTFDGGGHTITVSISNTSDQGTAPFRFIKNATIKNVKTTGTVTGGMHCAGLVGFAQGTNTIQNCHVDVAVTGSGSNHSHLGGVLGHGLSSTTTITDCLFSGSISNAGTATGIIYGWADNGTHTIVNCLAAGTYTSCNGIDMMKGSDTQTATNCYKNVSDGSKGTQTDATGDALVALLGAGWVNNSGNVVPKMNANIVNPTFSNVTLVATAPTAATSDDGKVSLTGTYSPFTSTDGLLFDAHNTANGAFYAALSATRDGYTFSGWYTDAGLTTEATSIPFAADGSVTLYTKWKVPYILEDGTTAYCTNYTVLDNTMTTIPAGWYVVNSDVEFSGDLSTDADGEVNIILCDGATLTANKIDPNGNSDILRIYGQSQSTGTANISGRIVATSSLQIYGGTINATGNIACAQSSVVIYGGNVTAAKIDGFRGLNFTGGTITAGTLQVSEEGDIKLGGATVKANSYNVTGNVTILPGITYYDGMGASYTAGNLSADQISDIAGKTLTPAIVLADDADNTTAIATAATLCTGGKTLAVQLSGHTLYKDGYWNTLTLPFAVSDFAGTPLEGATVKELLTTSNLNGEGVLTLNFSNDLTAIEAGKPYIVKWATTGSNIVNPVFGGVTIDDTMRDVDFTGGWFKGNYAPLPINDANRNKIVVLAVGSKGNMLGYVNTDRTLGAFHAYFYIPGSTQAREFVLNADDESTQTGIGHTEITEITEKADAIYDLQGRRVENPKKGLYIVNGRKVVIK